MEYNINSNNLIEKAKEEIAHEAARRYSNDGALLYDSIWPTSKDEPVLEKALLDTVNDLMTSIRLANVNKTDTIISFYLPELDSNMESSVSESINRFIVLGICQRWFSLTDETLSNIYIKRCAEAKRIMVDMLYTRKKVKRI